MLRVTLDKYTVIDLLGCLDELEICDETGQVRRHVNLFVNTAHVRDRDGLDTALVAGDVLTILPAVSGG